MKAGTADSGLEHRIALMRRFNRFYTAKIGVLREGLLDSAFPLPEARVLYELANRERPVAAELAKDLGLDPGYLSRILRGFERRGLLSRQPSPEDGRRSLLSLTEAGRQAFAPLDARSRSEIGAMLVGLSAGEQRRLIEAMRTIESLLGAVTKGKPPYLLRPHRPGDMGWIVHRQAVLYAEEYGWDEQFEALIAEIAAGFIKRFDPKRERCWIAEREGEIVGSVFLVKKSATAAKLRLLYVEPEARGLGIGSRLVAECIRFARQVGYRKITLWTNSILVAARHIYEAAGFRLVGEEAHHSFGHDLVAETWELRL
ncbi:MAG TPA: bifunctional helix-turn-helix transcriptional regulator/GNAT family N-acetyltransferase [Stellaceae bacterium]|nr:bifunctional helix-turn-helix transcriptional regulator/GNAT family N-acetyltransferase [Stellaceae bacterium]